MGKGSETAQVQSGALGSSIYKLRGARGMNYDRQRGFLCRGIDGRLGFGQGRGETVGPATILVFPTACMGEVRW